jgi:predicted transcriptional regulator
MDRMVAKGLLTTKKMRNLSLFRSAITPAQAQRGELAYALKHAFDGAMAPMFQCLLESNKLGAEELNELEELIKARKRAAKK